MSSSQIFKQEIPLSICYEFLKLNCMIEKGFYLFNLNAFKKAQYNASIPDFLEKCKPYYYKSKQKYLNNPTINGVTTVLRQVFNYHNIPYTNKIKYSHSTYTIEYFFSENTFNESQKSSQKVNHL
jgi:hypothetical protein